LITTLLDPGAAPARELAELYQARREIETALGSPKAQVKGPGVVLRSKTLDGVIQEIWALLCAYHAVREVIGAAAGWHRRTSADLLHQCSRRCPWPGRDPALFSPLAELTGSAWPRWPSSPLSAPGPGRAGPTRARPSAVPGTRLSQPTRPSGRNLARNR
jgi:hypothetical protein